MASAVIVGHQSAERRRIAGLCEFTHRDRANRQLDKVVGWKADGGHLKITPGKSFRLMTTGLPSMVFLTPGAFT